MHFRKEMPRVSTYILYVREDHSCNYCMHAAILVQHSFNHVHASAIIAFMQSHSS